MKLDEEGIDSFYAFFIQVNGFLLFLRGYPNSQEPSLDCMCRTI